MVDSMTKFNPENKKILTYGDCLKPAMDITAAADARQYLKDYIAYIQTKLDEEPRKYSMTAAQIAAINLRYFAGYYDNETRVRVERLFKCKNAAPINYQLSIISLIHPLPPQEGNNTKEKERLCRRL